MTASRAAKAATVALAAAALLLPALAQAQTRTAAEWRRITAADVEAAHALLAEDHPGALEEVGDADFRRRLAAGRAEALARAAQVTSHPGYVATLRGFANAMGDKHIWSRPLAPAQTAHWAGLLIARRGGAWAVAADEEAGDGPPLTGARLLSCDGQSADAIAERRLGGFRAVWSIPAQRIAAAPLLLVNDGNPFLTRPARCLFEQDGRSRHVALRWRVIGRAALAARARAVVRRGEAGFGVRRSGAGYWIALEELGESAEPVVAAAERQAADLRRAPFVVLDMRGNSGGNSNYGDRILAALYGPDVLAGPGARARGCDTVWRLSPRNLAQWRSYAEGAAGGDAAFRAAVSAQYRAGAAAAASGQALSGPPTCGARSAGGERRAPERGLYRGRLIVLTDHVCFSSCVLVSDRFRQLGALHVGEATDAMTRYFEVREDPLPSGLSAFSTLQALSPASPPQIGPFEPDRHYDGDISDTAALERWVAALVERGDDR